MKTDELRTLAKECVEEGVRWLEMYFYSWGEKVNFSQLNFESDTQNLLSQVTSVPFHQAEDKFGMDRSVLADYGFYHHPDMTRDEAKMYYLLLVDAWRSYLEGGEDGTAD